MIRESKSDSAADRRGGQYAGNVSYDPASLAQWGSDPGDVQEALDYLASSKFRTKRAKYYSQAVAAGDTFMIDNIPKAATITKVAAMVDTGSITVDLYHRSESSPNSGTSAIVSNQTVNSTFGNLTLAASAISDGDWLVLKVLTIASGSPAEFWLKVEYTIN